MAIYSGGIDHPDSPRSHPEGSRYIPRSDPNWIIGEVADIYPEKHTMLVVPDRSGNQSNNIEVSVSPRFYDPSSQAREMVFYKRGTKVFLTRAPGYWVCIGAVPRIRQSYRAIEEGGGKYLKEAAYQSNLTPAHIAIGRQLGGDDIVYKNRGSRNYRGQGPKDVMPGDWFLQGSEGNAIGVLDGGLSFIKGGAFSQIFLSQIEDHIKMLARKLSIFTGFGEIKTISASYSGDSVSGEGLEINGSVSSERAYSTAGESSYDFQVVLGGGKNLLDVRLGRNSSGSPLYSFKVDNAGRVHRYSSGGYIDTSDIAPKELIKGNASKIIDGDYYKKLNKKYTVAVSIQDDVSGTKKSKVSGDSSSSVGGTKIENYAKQTKTVGDMTKVATGGTAVEESLFGSFIQSVKSFIGTETKVSGGGSIKRSTDAGDINDTTVTGSVEKKAGIASMKLSPNGKVSLGNNISTSTCKMEVVTILSKMCELLANTTAPGYGSPLSTSAQWATLKAEIDGVLKI